MPGRGAEQGGNNDFDLIVQNALNREKEMRDVLEKEAKRKLLEEKSRDVGFASFGSKMRGYLLTAAFVRTGTTS